MPEIAIAESSKKRRPKTLDHLEIHPQLGGGHVVKHVYTDYAHDTKEVKFNEDGKSQERGAHGEHILHHLTKHAGLPPMSAVGAGDATEEEEEEEE